VLHRVIRDKTQKHHDRNGSEECPCGEVTTLLACVGLCFAVAMPPLITEVFFAVKDKEDKTPDMPAINPNAQPIAPQPAS
jgi:hypothetical protein